MISEQLHTMHNPQPPHPVATRELHRLSGKFCDFSQEGGTCRVLCVQDHVLSVLGQAIMNGCAHLKTTALQVCCPRQAVYIHLQIHTVNVCRSTQSTQCNKFRSVQSLAFLLSLAPHPSLPPSWAQCKCSLLP